MNESMSWRYDDMHVDTLLITTMANDSNVRRLGGSGD